MTVPASSSLQPGITGVISEKLLPACLLHLQGPGAWPRGRVGEVVTPSLLLQALNPGFGPVTVPHTEFRTSPSESKLFFCEAGMTNTNLVEVA